jgi:glycosidase
MKKWFLLMAVTGGLTACNNADSPTNKNEGMNQTNGKTVAWAHHTNIYEVNVRQYTQEGTFNAFAKEMPRLREMGVETLWFMPITPIAQKNKKGSMGSPYACSDYTSINSEFGTLEDFKNLVKKAHELGFKVIIDWVANHTGWDHVWTKSRPDYYLKDSATNDFKIASGMDDIIELDYKNPALRQAMVDAMKYWVQECDIDGFRCDLAAWVEVDFWQEARPKVDSVKHLFWLGEFDELENADYGKVFDASYSWSWMHKTKDFYQQHLPLAELDSLLNRYSQLGDNSMRAWFTSNHDENSWNGTEYEKYGDMATALAVFSVTWNGVPLLYSGQELPNHKRLQFFEKDPIDWNGKYERAGFYKTLLQLHSTHPALRGGDATVTTYRLHTSAPDQVMAYLRRNGDQEVLVLLNLSARPVDMTLADDQVKGNYTDVFSGQSASLQNGSKVMLGAWGWQVFKK